MRISCFLFFYLVYLQRSLEGPFNTLLFLLVPQRPYPSFSSSPSSFSSSSSFSSPVTPQTPSSPQRCPLGRSCVGRERLRCLSGDASHSDGSSGGGGGSRVGLTRGRGGGGGGGAERMRGFTRANQRAFSSASPFTSSPSPFDGARALTTVKQRYSLAPIQCE